MNTLQLLHTIINGNIFIDNYSSNIITLKITPIANILFKNYHTFH